MLDAEIGCYLSHYFAIQHFLKSPSSYALILEDDMDFVPYELIQVIQDLLHDKDKWDIANLKPMKGHPVRVATLMHSRRSLTDFTANFWGAGAYLLNRKAGNALLKNSLPIIMPYDWYFQRDWEFGVKFRGVSPSPFDTTGGTTIQEKRVPAESISSLTTSSFFKGSAIAVRRLRFYLPIEKGFKLSS